MSEQTHSFQAEVSRLLEIVAGALYSNSEIFLRELVSNASDACDRLRYLALTEPGLTAEDPDFAITLTADKDAGTLVVADNGLGMSRDELVENLGTIARSGTAAFLKRLEDQSADVNQIGQFGVGFYSAFMVADEVTVDTRRAGEAAAWCWRSDGKGDFTVGESADAPARGTRIILKLKPDQKEYLEPERLRRIVKTYSDHVAVPVRLTGETENLNTASALWRRPKSEITDAQYKEFYHHVAHAFDEPWLRAHFKAEGVVEYTGLLYIPAQPPFDLFQPERKHGVKLYVKRVFITDDCAELIPPYLRFLKGVVDSEDLPLNISREMLQNNPLLAKIRGAIVKRVLADLKKRAEADAEDYGKFWGAFGAVLKEGLYEDLGRREDLLPLLRVRTTGREALTSLDDYLARMKEGQDAIYFITGDDLEGLARSPQLEGFISRGVEVLLLTDPVDEFWVPALQSYQDKPFRSVTQGALDLDKVAGGADKPAEDGEAAAEAPGLDAMIAFLRLTLKEQVKDVRASERLTESPVCLVADEGDMDMHLERLLRQHQQISQSFKRILEVNPRHPLIRALSARVTANGAAAELEEVGHLLLDQALIMEGEGLPDPAAFSRRLSAAVARGLVPAGGTAPAEEDGESAGKKA
ncbi:MAG: molecular chaperone HtpG [Kiloniellales bacterium]|nr:molecular chaperone HtpG [Kiloniellales bacterium]